MNETVLNLDNSKDNYLAYVKSILVDKNKWYRFTDSGTFDWNNGLEEIRQLIREGLSVEVSVSELSEIVKGSFTPEALIKANEVDSQTFIDQLLTLSSPLIVWTEGDEEWQSVKAENTGLKSKLDQAQATIRTARHKKDELLREILSEISTQNTTETVHVMVIDDKTKNVEQAEGMRDEFKDSIKIHGFNILTDEGRNFDACLEEAQKILLSIAENNRLEIKEKLILIVDMDNVIIDTRGVMNNIVASKVADLVAQRKNVSQAS